MLKCHIVKDLLPNYSEGLVAEETKLDIQAHLQGCASCRQLFGQLEALEVEPPDTASSTKEINYLKKINARTRGSIAVAVAGILLVFGLLFWVFAIGWRAKASDVEIFTEFQRPGDYGITQADKENVYLTQSWAIHLELVNGRGMADVKTEFVYDENNVEVGRVLTVYEAPAWPMHSVTRYTTGYSYEGTQAPPDDFDYLVTVRFRDGEIVYSMREEGLFTEW